MRTKQIVFTAPYTAQLLEIEYWPPRENEVTVELEYTAVSAGTEKANFIGQRNGTNIAEGEEPVFPRTVGYSGAGYVREAGSGVRGVRVGDRVAVFWGKHQKYITISEKNVVKIPEEVSSREAALALISTFPMGAIRKTRLEMGESALVMGLGILGLFAVQELRAAGACPVIAADPVAERREMALRLGADYALDPMEADFDKKVREMSGGGVHVCIEVTGLGQGLIQALDCMRRMGRVALLGCTRSSKFEIDYYGKVHGPGITLIGAHTMARPRAESAAGMWTDEDDMKAVLRMIRGKRLNFRDMISEIRSPLEAQDVYTRLAKDRNFPIGVLFDWREIQ